MALISCMTPCTALFISFPSLWMWQLQHRARMVVAEKLSFWSCSIRHGRMGGSLEDIAKSNVLSKIGWDLQAMFLPAFEGICSLWSFPESTEVAVLWVHIAHAIQIRGFFFSFINVSCRDNNSGLSKRWKQLCFLRNVWKPILLYVFLHYITICSCNAVGSYYFYRKCSSTNCLSHIQPHKTQGPMMCMHFTSDYPWLKSRNCSGSRPVNTPDLTSVKVS